MDPATVGVAMSVTSSNNADLAAGDGVPDAAVGRLAETLSGQVLLPGAGEYDRARRLFNAMIQRRPAVILRCASPGDVVEGVTFARTEGLPISVKGGGHGVAGKAVCDRGLMLDLSPMKAVDVDAARRLVTVQSGVTLGELDRATAPFGLATPTGVVSMTGLAGLALGGGLGWLNGQHGLTCDNLVAADVVTAAAAPVAADAEQNPDLLWGLRGGGGNFGVVTSFTFRLHPIERVLAGFVTYPSKKARDALRLYHEFASGCPDSLSANASVARGPDGGVAVSIAVCYVGTAERGDALLRPLRSLGPEVDAIAAMSYATLQQAPDGGFPPGQQRLLEVQLPDRRGR